MMTSPNYTYCPCFSRPNELIGGALPQQDPALLLLGPPLPWLSVSMAPVLLEASCLLSLHLAALVSVPLLVTGFFSKFSLANYGHTGSANSTTLNG